MKRILWAALIAGLFAAIVAVLYVTESFVHGETYEVGTP